MFQLMDSFILLIKFFFSFKKDQTKYKKYTYINCCYLFNHEITKYKMGQKLI